VSRGISSRSTVTCSLFGVCSRQGHEHVSGEWLGCLYHRPQPPCQVGGLGDCETSVVPLAFSRACPWSPPEQQHVFTCHGGVACLAHRKGCRRLCRRSNFLFLGHCRCWPQGISMSSVASCSLFGVGSSRHRLLGNGCLGAFARTFRCL
jgi:hypothetical protein